MVDLSTSVDRSRRDLSIELKIMFFRRLNLEKMTFERYFHCGVLVWNETRNKTIVCVNGPKDYEQEKYNENRGVGKICI